MGLLGLLMLSLFIGSYAHAQENQAFIVRGDSLVRLGEVADDNTNSNMTEVEMSEIQELREKMPASEKVQWDF